MWYELFIFLKWVEKNSYLNGLMEVFFVKFLRFSNLCRGFQPFATIFRAMEVFFATFVWHFFEDTFRTRLIESEYHVVLTHLHVSQTKVLQHTCFHFWNVIKTFVETPKITVDVSVNKSKCVKVGNADAVEGATLKQTANFFHLCYKIVKKYKHHYIIF